MPKKDIDYDFSGIATAYEVLCGDGRVIRDGAFEHQNGARVPLVWRHMQDDIRNYLGDITLTRNEGSPTGVRGYAKFADTAEGRKAKKLVHSGTIESLSIWANEIVEEIGRFELAPGVIAHRSVTSGVIREVSLVVRGMNPGAKIDEVIRHSTDPLDPDTFVYDGLIIHSGIPIEIDIIDEDDDEEEEEVDEEVLEHGESEEEPIEETEESTDESEESEESEDQEEVISHQEDGEEDRETIAEVLESLNEDQLYAVEVVLHSAMTGETPPSSSTNDDGISLGDIFETLTQKQKDVVQYLAGTLAEEDGSPEPEEEPDETLSQEGELEMPKTYNPFEKGGQNPDIIAHQKATELLLRAKKMNHPSLKTLFNDTVAEGDEVIKHSITDVDYMFPDARAVEPGGPMLFANRDQTWFRDVLSGVHPRMFGKIKSWYADISADAARAKGYTTGNQKVEEVLAILKRTTDPQTVYKFQKMDRDDLVDITDFNVVAWLKSEMRLMLDEEIARAILIGDGRSDVDDDRIFPANIRPIYSDADVYTHKAIYNVVGSEDDWVNFTDTEVLAFVDHITKSMEYYQGAGSPVLFCQPALVSRMVTVRDTTGRRVHENLTNLAAALGVSRIVKVPVMTGLEDTGVVNPTGFDQNGAAIPAGTYDIATMGIIVNLSDYTVGADKGGETNFFDNFDLNFNKLEYLYETRMSGALVRPKSAIAVQLVTAKTA